MHSPINKLSKRASKRRNRSKKRRKQRQQRKLQNVDIKNEKCRSKFKKFSQKQSWRWDIQQQQKSLNDASIQQSKWEALCLETYQRLTSWQCEAQLNFWKARTEYLQNENKLLKQQLESIQMNDEDFVDEEHDVKNNEDIDAGYLEFISITHKHREELRRTREANKTAI